MPMNDTTPRVWIVMERGAPVGPVATAVRATGVDVEIVVADDAGQRVRSLLTDDGPAADEHARVCDGLRIDRRRHQASIDDRELRLTPTEFNLLWTLAAAPGQVFTRAELIDALRGEAAVGQARTIDVHVKSIRRKLGERADLIETVHGLGYRLRQDGRNVGGR